MLKKSAPMSLKIVNALGLRDYMLDFFAFRKV